MLSSSVSDGTRSIYRARISAVDRLEYFLRSRASKVVVLALVANTMVAQLLYNSAGQLVIGNQVLLAYLIVSAICSTVAFALFEVSTIFQLHDLMALDGSIKAEIGAEKLMKRGYFVLAVSSLINFFSVLYFLALAWHTGSGVGTKFPLDDLPQPWNWLYYAVHASAYTAVLFLAGIFGERPKSGKEVILATQRALEQQALERWKLQKEAQIEQMIRDGVPLGAVAAALASPETAERIAVLESATTGGLSALDAARLSLRRAGWDDTTLDGLERVRGDSPRENTASRPRLNVATGTPAPVAHGRSWTAEDYATRDAALIALGLPANLLDGRRENAPVEHANGDPA
jgi:hypothetical protein